MLRTARAKSTLIVDLRFHGVYDRSVHTCEALLHSPPARPADGRPIGRCIAAPLRTATTTHNTAAAPGHHLVLTLPLAAHIVDSGGSRKGGMSPDKSGRSGAGRSGPAPSRRQTSNAVRPTGQPAVEASLPYVVLDLRRVLYFVTVAETLSYTKAAERLHLSTSGLSQQIKVLEREVHAELLVRDTRHVTLTPAGAQLLASGRELLEAHRNPVTGTRLASGGEPGESRLAIVTGAEASFEPVLQTLQERYPALRLSTLVTKYAAAMQALVDGSVDAAISWSYLLHQDDTPPSGLRWRAVGEDEAVAGLPPRLAPPDGAPIPRGAGVDLGALLILFDRRYAPAAYDFAIENIFGGDVGTETVLPIAVMVRAQEAMAHEAAELGGIAPVAKSISHDLGDILEFRSFDPPWFMELACAWIQSVGTPLHLHSLMEIAHAWAASTARSSAQRPGTGDTSPTRERPPTGAQTKTSTASGADHPGQRRSEARPHPHVHAPVPAS